MGRVFLEYIYFYITGPKAKVMTKIGDRLSKKGYNQVVITEGLAQSREGEHFQVRVVKFLIAQGISKIPSFSGDNCKSANPKAWPLFHSAK